MKTYQKIVLSVAAGLLLSVAVYFALKPLGENQEGREKCDKMYNLDSCELYNCRANYSNTLSGAIFNNRNYEICKIIISNKLDFNESLPLLEVITYDN